MYRLFVWLTGLLCAGSLVAAEGGVVVHVTPAKIVRRSFDPARPPAEMPRLTPPEIGQCVYEFGCEMETRVVHRGVLAKPVRARITGTTLTTQLTITLWTPLNGPPGVVDVPSRGEQALQASLRELQSRVIKAYLAETLTRCSYAQKRFDAITEHSRARVPVRDAITRAIAEEKQFYAAQTPRLPDPTSSSPSTSPKRAHPTRPRA